MHVDVQLVRLYCIVVELLSTTAKPALTPVVAFWVEKTKASVMPSAFEWPSNICRTAPTGTYWPSISGAYVMFA